MKTINETNYFERSKALFEVVTDQAEFEKVLSLKPAHKNSTKPRYRGWLPDLWYVNEDYNNFNFDLEDFDEDRLERLQVVSMSAKYPHHDDNRDLNYYEVLEHSFSYKHMCDFFRVQTIPELISKTWVIDGYIYRYSYFWGKLKNCLWDLDLPNYEAGHQGRFILAKCPIDKFQYLEDTDI